MTTSTGNPLTCTCGGTGEYTVRDEDGLAGSISTHPCACRLQEPLRYGEARWWSLECMGELEHKSMTGQHEFTATIKRELPMSADNYRLHRTAENIYWPTMADIEGDISSGSWTSDMLRDLATWLNQVADEVDRTDAPETPTGATRCTTN